MAYKNVQYEAGKFKTETGGSGDVTDVTLDGVSVVNQQGVAELSSPTIPVQDVEVNGASVVNAQGVAEIPAIPDEVVANPSGIALTALTKLQVGNSIYSVGGNHAYSTSEKVVGTWIDGKPLYEKTFKKTNVAEATSSTVLISANDISPDLERNYFIEGMFSSMPLNFYVEANARNNVWGDRAIYYQYKWYGSAASFVYITVRYTKTTDSV